MKNSAVTVPEISRKCAASTTILVRKLSKAWLSEGENACLDQVLDADERIERIAGRIGDVGIRSLSCLYGVVSLSSVGDQR